MSMASFKYTSIMFRAGAVAFSAEPYIMRESALSFRYLKCRAEIFHRQLPVGGAEDASVHCAGVVRLRAIAFGPVF
jgi:hypothetical protein